MAVHDVGDEGADGDVLGAGRRHRQDRPVLHDRNGLVATADEVVPGPHPGVACRIQAPGTLEPPTRLGPDRPQADADRQPILIGGGRLHGGVHLATAPFIDR